MLLNIFDSLYKNNLISIEKNEENNFNLLIKILIYLDIYMHINNYKII